METDAKIIETIWQALQRPAPVAARRDGAMDKFIAERGWASRVDIEDYLLSQDQRLDPSAGVEPRAFAVLLGLPFRAAFPRPKRRNEEVIGCEMLSAVDVAALCIWLERLGFRIDITDLCSRIRVRLGSTTHLTDEEISVLFYDKNRHRLPPLTLSAPNREWRGRHALRHKTPQGYRIEYLRDENGLALDLTVSSPKYRRPSEQKPVKCPDCGMDYVKGLLTDEQAHRTFHRQRLSTIKPMTHRRFGEALKRNLNAAWVDAKAARWKRELVFYRAREFKREFGYDFVQWQLDAAHDPLAIGFLFSDEHDRVVGDCSFRPQYMPNARPWRLDWIWVCPDARRQGHLSRHWERFRHRFGDFDVEHPISEAMQSFLQKHGGSHLIRHGTSAAKAQL